MSVPALARSLEAEGVERIVITTEEPGALRRRRAAGDREVRDRREMLRRAARARARSPGVTVLLHDQACAAELRRERKRGRAPEPPERVRDQRARLRGLRRLRREVELPVGRAGRDRVRPQDADQPDELQQGLLLPRGRLPVVRHRDRAEAVQRARAADPLPARRAARARGALRRPRRRAGAAGRASAAPAWSPSARCSGWRRCSTAATSAGSTRPGSRRRRARSISDLHISRAPVEEGVTPPSGSRRRAARLRPARRRRRARSLRVADPERTVAVVSEHVTPTAGMVGRRRRARAGPRRGARGDRRGDAGRRQRLPRRAADRGAAVRRRDAGERRRARRGLAARRAPGLARRARGGVPAQRRRRRAQPRRVRLGPRLGRRIRRSCSRRPASRRPLPRSARASGALDRRGRARRRASSGACSRSASPT